jgi:hypothetical protein
MVLGVLRNSQAAATPAMPDASSFSSTMLPICAIDEDAGRGAAPRLAIIGGIHQHGGVLRAPILRGGST